MKFKEQIKMKGKVTLRVYDARECPTYESTRRKEPLFIFETENLIVTVGKYLSLDLLLGATSAKLEYCGVGSSTTAPSAAQTDLITPIGRIKVTEASRSALVATFLTFFGIYDCNGTWNESGMFTAVSAGVMFCRALLASTFTKTTSVTATVEWQISW